MTNFVDDNTALPYPKSDLKSLQAGLDPTQAVQAVDWNAVCQAAVDLRANAKDPTKTVLPDTAVTPGVYAGANITVDSKGRVTAATNGTSNVGTTELPLNVKDYGALGNYNSTTGAGADDRPAFVAAFAAAIAGKTHIRIPPGVYKLSKAVPIVGAVGLTIDASAFASIYHPSDDVTLVPDSSWSFSYAQIRAGFVFRNCRDVTIQNLEFVGGVGQELTNSNVGPGIYATRCVGMRVISCRQRNGATLFAQDALVDSAYASGNVIAVSGGVVTLTNPGDPNGAFHSGMLNRFITITNATNKVNEGRFEILSVVSATQLTYLNAAAIAESSSMVWVVNDGDRDTKIVNCRWDNARASSFTGSDSTYQGCVFQRPMTTDAAGIHDAFVVIGTTVTLTDATAPWDASVTGRYVKIAGSTSAANDGVYKITAATPKAGGLPATITYTNASAVAELAPLTTATWFILGGERVGKGNGASAISSASGVVTFTADAAVFRSDDIGKSLCITDATSGANNGSHVITRFISSTQVQYVQTGAVSETYAQVFCVDGFDTIKGDNSVGPAIASTSTSVAANSLTDTSLTMVTNAYAARYLYDSAGRQWPITSNTATIFTLVGGTPAAGSYTVSAGATYGSSHGIYLFAGRSRVRVEGCTFRGVRTIGVKVSGTAIPIKDVEVCGCVFEACGAAAVFGADDVQDHLNFNFHHNRVIDCASGRIGWSETNGVNIEGSRNVSLCDNQFYASRDVTASRVNGGALGGYFGISVGRFSTNLSGPLEDVAIERNRFTMDAASCVPSRIASSAINADRVGQWGKAGTNGVGSHVATLSKSDSGALTLVIAASAGTMTRSVGSYIADDGVSVGSTLTMSNFVNGGNNVTKVVSAVTATVVTFTSNSGLVDETRAAAHFTTNIMTLLDGAAEFAQSDVGHSIQICNAPDSGNNSTTALETKVGDWLVLAVLGTAQLRFQNTAGVGGGVSAGTYRIKPTKRRRAGACSISHNYIGGFGGIGITTTQCVAPQIIGNVFDGVSAITDSGSVTPRIAYNIELTAPNAAARIQISAGTAWPTIHDNYVTNGALGGGNLTNETGAARTDMGIGIGSGTARDHPLLGIRGRAVPTNGRAELVFAFGAGHVDGDTIAVNGNIFTYKTSSPDIGTGGTFASAAGLIACLDATARAGNSLGSLGLDCADYGASFTTPVTTGHIRIRGHAPINSANPYYIDTINVLNSTALVIPRNDTGGGESFMYARGEGAAEPFTSSTFTTTFALNQVNKTAHGYATGDGPARLTTTGVLPAGYNLLTDYWVISTAANTFQLATSYANALAGTAVTITDDGTGTHTITNYLARRLVAWSMQATQAGAVRLAADAAGAALVLAGGWYHEKLLKNAGCCEVVHTLRSQGIDEYRWGLT